MYGATVVGYQFAQRVPSSRVGALYGAGAIVFRQAAKGTRNRVQRRAIEAEEPDVTQTCNTWRTRERAIPNQISKLRDSWRYGAGE